MDISYPKSMMQLLLDETRKGFISLIKYETPNLTPQEVQQCNISFQNHSLSTIDVADNQEILKFIWKEWDFLKGKFFECNRENFYGNLYRSYINLMTLARNEWAHSTYTYEDILHYSFIVQRFFRDTKQSIDVSVVDQIIDTCFQEISGRYTRVPLETVLDGTSDYGTLDNHGESSVILETDNDGGSTGLTEISAEDENIQEDLDQVDKTEGEIEEGIEDYVTKEELKEILSDFRANLVVGNSSTDYSVGEELDKGQSGDVEDFSVKDEFDDLEDVTEEEQGILLHKDEIEAENGAEKEAATISYSEIREAFETILAKKDYKQFNYKVMEFKSPPIIRPGTYPDTLYMAAEGPIWGSWGPEKLKLVEEHLVDVLIFALSGFIPDHMKGEWEGTELICIPSKEKARIQFGQNKARMLCASMDRISEWLENYY